MFYRTPVLSLPLVNLTNSFDAVVGEDALEKMLNATGIAWEYNLSLDGASFYSEQFPNCEKANSVAQELNSKFGGARYFNSERASWFGGYFGKPDPYQLCISLQDAASVLEVQSFIDEFLANKQKAQDVLAALREYTQIESWEQGWPYDGEPLFDHGKIPFTTKEIHVNDASRACDALNVLFGAEYFKTKNRSSNVHCLKAISINEEDIIKLDIEKLKTATPIAGPKEPIVI